MMTPVTVPGRDRLVVRSQSRRHSRVSPSGPGARYLASDSDGIISVDHWHPGAPGRALRPPDPQLARPLSLEAPRLAVHPDDSDGGESTLWQTTLARAMIWPGQTGWNRLCIRLPRAGQWATGCGPAGSGLYSSTPAPRYDGSVGRVGAARLGCLGTWGPTGPSESSQARRPGDLLVRAEGPGEPGRPGILTWQ
jgi:hypothetical protein